MFMIINDNDKDNDKSIYLFNFMNKAENSMRIK